LLRLRILRFGRQGLVAPFRNRSGRVVSVSRLTLALTFLLSLLVSHATGGKAEPAALVVMACYAVTSAVLVVVTWDDWWREHRLAAATHVGDMLVFGSIVILTSGYTSPFYTFSVFLILSAMIQWGSRGTTWTAAAVATLFLLSGLITSLIDAVPLEVDRVLIRTAYLIVLSVLMIWFGVTQEASRKRLRFSGEEEEVTKEPPAEFALRRALAEFSATRGTLVWTETEEPWFHVSRLSEGKIIHKTYGPEEIGDSLPFGSNDGPVIFDRGRNHALALADGGRVTTASVPSVAAAQFLRGLDLDAGLLVRLRSTRYAGDLIVQGTDGWGRDHLIHAEAVGKDLSSLFDRYALLSSHAEEAVERAKAALARDLHDSVVQSLSGANFRLEALRNWIRAGRPADEEITGIQQHLSVEQQNVRRFIARMRSGPGSSRLVDIAASLSVALDSLCKQWLIECKLVDTAGPVQVPAWMDHSLRQIVREAIANAVRHGGATRVECELSGADTMLALEIGDNGRGFAMLGAFDEDALREKGLAPWSIYERTKNLGGNVSLFSHPSGSRLRMEFPLEAQA